MLQHLLCFKARSGAHSLGCGPKSLRGGARAFRVPMGLGLAPCLWPEGPMVCEWLILLPKPLKGNYIQKAVERQKT